MSGSRWAALALVVAVATGVTVAGAPASAATDPPLALRTWFTNDPLTAPPAPAAGGAPVTVMMCAEQTGGFEVIMAVQFDISAIDPTGHSSPDDPTIAPGAALNVGGLGLDSGPQCVRIHLTFGAGAPGGRWQLRAHLATYRLSIGGILQPLLPLTEQDDPFTLTVSVTVGPPAPQPPAMNPTHAGAGPATNPTAAAGSAAAATNLTGSGDAGDLPSGNPSRVVAVQLTDPITPAVAAVPDDGRSSWWWILGVAFAVVCLGAAGAILRGRRRT